MKLHRHNAGHMTKMAAMYIYIVNKHLNSSFREQ